MGLSAESNDGATVFEAHGRSFEQNRYVYPVVSRRARGISIGVNLSPSKLCNFACAYCQVDRTGARPEEMEVIDLARLRDELHRTIDLVVSDEIYRKEPFSRTPEPLRRLSDVALSGDGEPTLHVDFAKVVSTCADVLKRRGLPEAKLVLLTNASLLHRPRVRQALKTLDEAGGEIWAKLDAGTEETYRAINRCSTVPFQQVLCNLRDAAIARPLVIQSLWTRRFDESPSGEEQEAFCDRLNEIVAAGGRIKLVQIHTVARVPAEAWINPLERDELEALADVVRLRTGLRVEVF